MGKYHTSLGKKGNLFDYVEVGKFALIVVILGFLVYTILTQFSVNIDQVETGDDNYTGLVENSRDKIITSIDWASLLFLMSALIFSVIVARKVPANAKGIALILFVCVVFLIIAFAFSNIFGGMMDKQDFANYVNINMPITKIILQYFPFITAIYQGIVLVVFFRKDDEIG